MSNNYTPEQVDKMHTFIVYVANRIFAKRSDFMAHDFFHDLEQDARELLRQIDGEAPTYNVDLDRWQARDSIEKLMRSADETNNADL